MDQPVDRCVKPPDHPSPFVKRSSVVDEDHIIITIHRCVILYCDLQPVPLAIKYPFLYRIDNISLQEEIIFSISLIIEWPFVGRDHHTTHIERLNVIVKPWRYYLALFIEEVLPPSLTLKNI